MSQRQGLQHTHCTRFLNYGHLGTITYHEDDQSWRPLRIVEPHVAGKGHTDTGEEDDHFAFPLRHLSSKVVYDGPAATKNLINIETRQSVHEDINEFGSGSGSSSTSHATKAETTGTNHQRLEGDAPVLAEKHCPNCSELLAFGSAVRAAPDGARSELVHVPIAAFVSGNSAQSVRLARIEAEIVESHHTSVRNTSSHVPCISSEDEAYWTSSGGPVQQICFAAASGYSSTWMAARLQSSTTIFHPLIHRRPVPPRHEMSQPSFLVLPSSVLDANPIFTIPISRTGGHSHADVSFHPQDHLKLALIDEHGNWSVWVIHGERQETFRGRFRVSLLFCGKIWTWDHEERLRTSLPYHDGWHRILWCGTSESPSDGLFILNRRTAAIYSLSGHLLGLKDFNLGHVRENRSILDVQPSKTVSGHYFVLTSSRLFWVNLEDKQLEECGRAARNSHVLLAWQHFRDRGDKTLRLILLETGMSRLQSDQYTTQMLTFGSHNCIIMLSSRRSGLGISGWHG
jgi:RNA polymerase I-specific transcription-initiation factor